MLSGALGALGEPRLKILTGRAWRDARPRVPAARGPRGPLISIIKPRAPEGLERASTSPAWYYLIRTRPRGQPRTASGSRSAIARVVLFDTEWASRPAIVRLGHMQEVFLRETAVSWIRLRLASTVPSKAWLETKEQYVCQQAQRGRGRHQCRFGCRGSVQKLPKAARSCDRSQGRSNTQMSG